MTSEVKEKSAVDDCSLLQNSKTSTKMKTLHPLHQSTQMKQDAF